MTKEYRYQQRLRARGLCPGCETCGKPLPHRWTYRKGQKVRIRFCCRACVPAHVFAAGGLQGRERARVNGRFKQFQAELARLKALERITGDELIASFSTVADRSYDHGYSACETKWRRRMGAKGQAA